MNLKGGIPVVNSRTTSGAMIGKTISAVASRLISFQAATVVSSYTAPNKTMVALDVAPNDPIGALSMTGRLAKGQRVMVAFYPPRGCLVLGSISPGDTTVTTYGTPGSFDYVRPAGLIAATVECQGAGGAGGGAGTTAAAQTSSAGGGAGGCYARKLLLASDIPASLTITVPSGAVGVSGTTGSSGAAASFGSLVIGDGGVGGSPGGGAAADGVFNAQAGGIAAIGTSVGDFVSLGQDGFIGMRMNTQFAKGGSGGSSVLGGGGRPSVNPSGLGQPGNQYGGGGAGSHNAASQAATAGGDGAQGIVVVTEIFG